MPKDSVRIIKETFIKAVAGSNGTESQAISQLKEIIRLRNMYFVYSEYNNMRHNFDRDSRKAIRILDDNYNEYKKLKSENKEKDFPSFVVKKI